MSSHQKTGIVHHSAGKCTVTTNSDGSCHFATAAAARAMLLCFVALLKFTSYHSEENPCALFTSADNFSEWMVYK